MIFLIFLSVALLAAAARAAPHAMAWMCLERCFAADAAAIARELDMLHANRDAIDAVSFELFNLGPKSALVTNQLSDVAPRLRKEGFETYAMISSYPYPDDFIDWMRQVFRNPGPFVDACVHEAKTRKLTGFNVDWEPTKGVLPDDSHAYAEFLATLGRELRARANASLTVAYAHWSPVYDVPLLAAVPEIDRLYDMSTYTANDTLFHKALKRAVGEVPRDRLGVGLMTYRGKDNSTLSVKEVAVRFSALDRVRSHVDAVGIWVTEKMPAYWFPEIRRWKGVVNEPAPATGPTPTGECARDADCVARGSHWRCDDAFCVCAPDFYAVGGECKPAERVHNGQPPVFSPLVVVVMVAAVLILMVACIIYCRVSKGRANRFRRLAATEEEIEDDDSTEAVY